MTETIRTVLFGAMHHCVTIYIRFQVITQHVRARFGRAAFVHEITSFGNDPGEDLAILADCCRNYEREEVSGQNSAGMFFFTYESVS